METTEKKTSPSKVVRGVTRPLANILSQGIHARKLAYDNARAKAFAEPTYDNLINLLKKMADRNLRLVEIPIQEKHQALARAAEVRVANAGFKVESRHESITISIPSKW